MSWELIAINYLWLMGAIMIYTHRGPRKQYEKHWIRFVVTALWHIISIILLR